MNDFTKKELIALEYAMELQLVNNPPENGKSSLLEKLQSMIENYCEHKDIKITSEVNYIKVCRDCEELLSYD